MAGILPANFEPRLPTIGEPPRLPAPTELALSDFTGFLWRQRWVMIGCLVLSAAAVGAYTVLARPVYEASSMVRFEHEQVNLPQLVEQLTTENRISTEMTVLQGRSAAQLVIDSLGLRAALLAPRHGRITKLFSVLRVDSTADTTTLRFRIEGSTRFAVWQEGSPDAAIWTRFGQTATLQGVTVALSAAAYGQQDIRLHIVSAEEAAKNFEDALKVSRPARDADLIELRFQASDPDLAARAANLLAAGLIASRETALQARTGLAVDFLRRQVDTLRIQLHGSEDALQKYREGARAVDPAEEARTQVGRLAQLQADRGGLDAEREALADVMAGIQRDSAASIDGGPSPYRRLIGFPSLLRNQAATELLNNLAAQENERSALLRRRTWQDQDVEMLTSRIGELDQQLKSIATTYLEGLTNQVAGLDKVSRQFGRALDSLPRKEVQTARLERDANILQTLYSDMQTRLKEAEVTRAVQDPSVRIVDRAYAAAEPLRPKPKTNLALSLVLGTLLGLSLSLGRELSDRSVRSRADALHAAGLPVLGAIPRVAGRLPRALRRISGRGRKMRSLGEIMERGDGRNGNGAAGLGPPSSPAAIELASRLVLQPDSPGAYSEAFNQLQTNLALAFQDHPLKVLVFTSPLPGEGKTLSAINFALTAAARGKKVLLIDADTRCGVVNQVFGCPRQPGFTELLSGKMRFEDGVRGVPVRGHTTLALLPSGALLNGPSREMTVERLRQTLTAIRAQFDMVVIDSPPVNILADAALLGAVADGVILVVRAGKTQREALSFAMDQLTAAKAPVIGTVLNDIDLDRQQHDDGAFRYLAEVEKYHAAQA